MEKMMGEKIKGEDEVFMVQRFDDEEEVLRCSRAQRFGALNFLFLFLIVDDMEDLNEGQF